MALLRETITYAFYLLILVCGHSMSFSCQRFTIRIVVLEDLVINLTIFFFSSCKQTHLCDFAYTVTPHDRVQLYTILRDLIALTEGGFGILALRSIVTSSA